ncbi:hypothetical protein [Gimesia fumaroli]|uniref:Uncharacterized protein n=1 Tax=Gimesia fumaroli TaxID=2527976 RepID=A0A518ICV3_9PLAN|nr:hypothetical protein [Gimesia fumaroli]QDV50870.1 hypothetical protein Enr17x_29150 [Gimesia fumaroli]
MPGFFEMLIIGILVVGLAIFPFWMICSKAGFPGWISLAVLFPVLNIVLLFFLAFAEWPALRNVPQQDRTDY